MSKVILRMMGGQYVHASLGLDDSYSQFYSFNKKGFRLEHPLKPHHNEVPCALYRINISNAEYARLIDYLNHFEKFSTQYSYAWFGLILCCLHITHKARKRYFCAQFVAEALAASGVAKIWKSSSLFLPDDFAQVEKTDLHFQGTLGGLENLVKGSSNYHITSFNLRN
jgi:inositol transport system substrate-binding protein